MEFHPLANIFPLLDGQAFSDLIADVIKHGIREPVWLFDGQLLDGRNRWRASQAAGVDCPTRDYEGDRPAEFVVSLNLHRRHLSESQRAMVAAKLSTMGQGARTDLASIEATSQVDAAELLNVSRSAVQRAKTVVDDGAPELIAAVERGDVAVSAAAQVASLPLDIQADIVATGPEEVREVAKTLRASPHVANNSGNNEWYTPVDYIKAARSVMGSIDTDPASSKVANKTVDAKKFFTAEQNGLVQKWAGNVWMNPPYAQPLIAEFAAAIVSKYDGGEIEQACVLVNNATDTAWFRSMAEASSATCFTKGRVRFIDPDGRPSGAPLQGQAVLYFGGKAKAFAEAFKGLGYTFVGRPVALAA